MCRDLIFHDQEHRFTLLQIADALAELDLEFIGFEFDNQQWVQLYQDRFSADLRQQNLQNWHRFENEHPHCFEGMYQFWVRLRTNSSS